jgi:DNA invertase Pin-like site-specific DNA recombinase/integrase
VSTEEQGRSGLGLAAQRKAIAAHANAKEWDVIWLCDEGASAKSLDRPAFREALGLLKRGEAQAVVVSKLDRLSRLVQDFAGLLAVARKQRWAVNALDVGVDTTTPGGELVANVMVAVAQWERRTIGERTSVALKAAQERGVKLGRPRAISKDAEARVYELRALGMSYKAHCRPAQRGARAYSPRRHLARLDGVSHIAPRQGGGVMANVRDVTRAGGQAFEVRWRADGKFRQRTFTVKREAERFALEVENEIAEGATTAPLVRRVLTVAQVVEASLEASRPGLKERTHRSYVSIYRNRVLPTFGKREVTEVTRADVQAWVTALHGEGLAPQTVHHCYVALKKAFRYAQDDRLISYNPCDSIRLPRNADAHAFAPVFLTAAEVETLAKQLDTVAQPYGLLVRFAAYTGLRAAEITGLRVRDLNLRAGHVEVRQTLQRIDGEWQVGTAKSKRSTREVPLVNRALTAEMREYLFAHPHRANPDALLWPGRMPGTHVVDFDRVLDVASFRRNYLRPALRALGMPEMRFHDLRHTYASLMLSVGRPTHKVSRWMGHASLVTTDTIYSHLYPGDYAEERDEVSHRLAAQR